jgi:hypothetical protein
LQVARDRQGRSNALFERVAKGWLRSAHRFSRRGSHHSRNQTLLALQMSTDLHRTLIQLSLRCTPSHIQHHLRLNLLIVHLQTPLT